MSGSTEQGGLAAAILRVQSRVPTLPKNATNPHFKSKFTPLDTIVEVVQPIMAEEGLTFSSFPSYDKTSGAPTLHYRLTHAPSGEKTGNEMLLLLAKNEPQGQGAAITYARRYALVSALNLVADEDVDGNMTAEPVRKTAPKPTPTPRKTLTDAQVKKAVGLLTDVDPRKVQLGLTARGVSDLPELTPAQVKELIAEVAA